MGLLDLRDADLKGFAALDAGRYDAEIVEITMDATKGGEDAKMPKGTPMMKIQFKILNPVIDGQPIDQDRRAFTQYVIPPKDYDKKKAATMKGMVARFFMATGDSEELVTSKDFDPDFEDYKGRPVTVILSKVPAYGSNPEDNEWQNNVKGVKKAGEGVGSPGGLL